MPPAGTTGTSLCAGEARAACPTMVVLSPRLAIELVAETHADVRVDVIREGAFPSRMLRMIFTPWRGLTLARTDE